MNIRKREIAHSKAMFEHENELTKEIETMYEQLGKESQAEFLRLFGGDEELSVAESRQRISRSDLYDYEEQLRKFIDWQEFELERLKGSGDNKTNDAKIKLLEKSINSNRTRHTEKIDVLLDNIELKLSTTTTNINDEITMYLNKRAEMEAMRQSGIMGGDITPQAVLQDIVVRDFKGADFSDNLWTNKELLMKELKKVLNEQMETGVNPLVAARQLREKVEMSSYTAERLLRTESSRVQADVQIVSAKSSGFEQIQFISTEDDRVCDICSSLHDQVFDVGSAENIIPAHPNCRCSFAAYVEGMR